VFDKESQVKQVQPFIIPGETLHAVFDCKGSATGFVGITNKRLMFYDKAFLRKKKALTSVPFSQITSVSSIDNGKGLFEWRATSELAIRAGAQDYEFEFHGGEKAQQAYGFIMTELLQNEPS